MLLKPIVNDFAESYILVIRVQVLIVFRGSLFLRGHPCFAPLGRYGEPCFGAAKRRRANFACTAGENGTIWPNSSLCTLHTHLVAFAVDIDG